MGEVPNTPKLLLSCLVWHRYEIDVRWLKLKKNVGFAFLTS